METQSYQDWSLSLHKRVVAQRVPISGSIEVTRRCNLSCVHCYNNLPLGDQKARRTELPYEEHCRILDRMAAEGCLWLLYTGGEIFVRKDFLDIYAHAKKAGFLITLFTNGTLITPLVAEYLAAWSPFSVEVSLYGRTAATHDRVTGVAGSFDRTMRGVKLLMEVGLPPILKTMVLKPNAHEIWDMKRFVEEELGLEFRFDAMINARVGPSTVPFENLRVLSNVEGLRTVSLSNGLSNGSGSTLSMPRAEAWGSRRVDSSTAPLSMRLSPQEVVELDLKDSKRINEWVTFCENFNRPAQNSEDGGELYACGGAHNAFAIDASGKLSTCVLWHGERYDLRQGSFKEGWEEFLLKVSKKKMTRHTKCVACELKSMCGMCPANGVLECEDAEEPVDFLCQVAHLRAYAFAIPVSPHGECEYCRGGAKHQKMMEVVGKLVMRNED